MSIISSATLLVAVVAAVIDVWKRRIPNVLTFGAAASALLYHMSASGASGAGIATTGWLVGFALFIPFFALGGMGAGDVKLIAALGAWLGPLGALQLAAATAIAGGVTALVVILQQRYGWQAFANLRLLFSHWRINGVQALPELTLAASTGPRLAAAVPIPCGTLGVLWWR